MSRRKEKCAVCTKSYSSSNVIHLKTVFRQDPYCTIGEALLEFANLELVGLVSNMDGFVCIHFCYQRLTEGTEFQDLVRRNICKLSVGVDRCSFSEDHDSQTACAEQNQQTTSIEIVKLTDCDEKIDSVVPIYDNSDVFDIQLISSAPAPQNQEKSDGNRFVKPGKEFISTHMKFQNFEYFELNGHRCCGCDVMTKTMDELLKHAADFHLNQRASEEVSSERSYVCYICSAAFETDQQLHSHQQVSSEKEVFLCKCCSHGFDTKQRIMEHMVKNFSEENDDYTVKSVSLAIDDRLNADYDLEELYEEDPIGSENNEQLQTLEDQFVTLQEDYDDYRILHTEAERCCCCGFFFADYDEMLAHALAKHQRSKSYRGNADCTCQACGESFKSKKSLKHHQATNSSFKKIFYCKLCKTSYVRVHLLARHILTSIKHRSDDFKDILKKRHDSQMAAILRKKCDNSRSFYGFGCCFVRCGATFDDEKQLQNHVEELHAVRRRIHISERTSDDHVCDVCQLSFIKEQNLQRHRYGWQMRKVNICSYCGKGFPSPAVLREHEQVEHTDATPQFECEHCGKRFKKKSLIKLHLVTHEENRKYGCDQCESRFRFGHQLKKHQQAVHPTELHYECKYCDRKMPNKERYDQHMRKHTGERPYECRHQCGRAFSHPTDRRRHEMALHTGEKPHRCSSCGLAYIRKRELMLHIQKNPDHDIEMSTHVFEQGILEIGTSDEVHKH